MIEILNSVNFFLYYNVVKTTNIMKHISKKEFFNQLNSCEYGRQYLELVTNPENHLGKKDKGEVHHIHPRKLGGDLKAPENLVKLSVFNHCLAHVLLAKAFIELNITGKHEALLMISMLSRKQYKTLSDIEKITLEDIYNWSILRQLGFEKAGKLCKEFWETADNEFRKKFSDKKSNERKKYWANLTEEERKYIGELQSKVQKEFYKNVSEDWKENQKIKNSIGVHKFWNNASKEWKEEFEKKISKGQKEFYKNVDPEHTKRRGNNISNSRKKYFANETQEQKEVRLKLLKDCHNTPEARKNSSEAQKKYFANETQEQKEARIISHKKFYLTESEEHKEIRKNKLKAHYENETQEQKEARLRLLKDCHNTQEARKNNSEAQRGSIRMTNGNGIIKLVVKEKQQEFYNKGYYRCKMDGSIWIEKIHTGRKGTTNGNIWINNGIISKFIKPEELINYLEWNKGRISVRKNNS